MKKIVLGAIVLLATAGCDHGIFHSVPEAKKEAEQRWNTTRAQMLYGVAKEHFKVGQLTQAAAKAHQAVGMDDKHIDARILLAKVFIEQGEHAAAQRELTTALEQAPESSEAFYLLGVAQEKGGQREEALASYRRAYALDSSSLAPVVAAAEVLVALGRTRDAEMCVADHVAEADNDPALFEVGGRIALMRKRPEKAVAFYRRALDLDPANTRYREELGRAYYLAGQHAEAIQTLRPLTKQADQAASPWVWLMVGDCELAAGNPRAARKAYEAAARLNPTSPGLCTKVGKALLAAGDPKKAILLAHQALDLDARSLEAQLVLGYALLRDGQAGEAIRWLKRTAVQHEDDSTVWCVLGQAHAADGDEVEAIRCYTVALRESPGNPVAQELLAAAQGGGK